MEAIKQIVHTPKNHEIRIKIPQYIRENAPIEIIMIVPEEHSVFGQKINLLRNAMKDQLFLNDLQEVSKDFEAIDLKEWEI